MVVFVKEIVHVLSIVPVQRIRQQSAKLLYQSVPGACERLRADLHHMIGAYNDLLCAAWLEPADLETARREYQEAVITIHIEIFRVRDRYCA